MTKEQTREIALKYFTENGINEQALIDYKLSYSKLWRNVRKHQIEITKDVKVNVRSTVK